jgi:hypothetical protein
MSRLRICERIRRSGAGLVPLATGALLACSAVTGTANAQVTEGKPGNADSLVGQPVVQPGPPQVAYDSSYNRDVSTASWTQALSYTLSRGRMSLNASGTSTTIDFPRSPGLGGKNGTIGGILNFNALRGLVFTLNGSFNRVVSTDLVSETSQRQNRLKVSGQYSISPLKTMSLQGVLSSELQRDHGLTIRPLGQERLRLLTRYNAAGDSVGVDSIFVHDQRDSTFMSGRQDGATAKMTWSPKTWLQITSDAAGTHIDPATTSQLRDFARYIGGAPVEVVDRSRFESPNDSRTYQTKLSYSGIRRATAWANVRGLHNTQQYFDKSLRGQEQLSLDQRGGALHVDYAPANAPSLSLEGNLNRSLSGYALRTGRSSLVTSRSLQASTGYTPSPRTRANAILTIDRQQNERQANGNGKTISRYLQASAAHRVSSRLSLDAAGTVSLTSFQYVDSTLDQDNVRTYVNVGGGYVVSARCSTLVHFSTTQGHAVAIDAARSGSNNVQTTYQMDAALRLGVTRTLSITQDYLLNAVYQIYDNAQAEKRNVLSRIRRIDTTISDSIFSLATIRVTHNFLFRDSGSFTKPPGGSSREYNVGSEIYQQTLGATLAITFAAGVQVFATQSLSNTRNYFPATNGRTVDNRWNLAIGATVERTLMNGAALRGSAQHIGAYTESSSPFDPLNEQDDWIAGVTFHKDF